MKYLLDTNIIIWFMEMNPLLPERIRDIILDDNNEILISTMSLWEITIKWSLGKLELYDELNKFLKDIDDKDYFKIISIKNEHLLFLSKLPFIHKDPFDRLIFSIARSENVDFLYTDEIFDNYIKEING